ncbi:MAG TPA: DUF2155 domain-containing protein, partial [Alphaproteobacteria bacterium]
MVSRFPFSCSLFALGLACLLAGPVHAQQDDQDATPTMQQVLDSLEGQDTATAESAKQESAPSPESVTTNDDVLTPRVTPEAPVAVSAPDATPPMENMNPTWAPATPATTNSPEAPTAERAETPPAPPKPPAYVAEKFAELQTLDKVTARTGTITVPVGETVAIGPLFLQVKTCQHSAPLEQPESAAFLQVWEATPKDTMAADKTKGVSQWVFSGWMFASSPALSAMDHPIYDIWVLNCKSDS